MPISHFRVLAILSATLLLTGCAGTTITVRHSPLYQTGPHIATVTAMAQNSKDGISGIDVYVLTGQMTNCTELGMLPSAIPCEKQLVQTGTHCSFSGNPHSATCDYLINPQDGTLITYYAAAESGTGHRSTGDPITFGGGAGVSISSAGASGKLVNWRTASPIWWHANWPCINCNTSPFSNSRAAPQGADHFQLVYFPANDIANPLSFSADVSALIEGAFFNNTDPYAHVYTFFANQFDLWAGFSGANVSPGAVTPGMEPPCSAISYDDATTLLHAAVSGTAVLLHAADCRDSTNLSFDSNAVTATVWAAAPAGAPSSWIFTHESGHMLFGLADEYGCDGGYDSISDPHNVFATASDCKTAATDVGTDPAQCTLIVKAFAAPPVACAPNHWRVDNGQVETMATRTITSNWQVMSGAAVARRVVKCTGGSCY